MKTRKNFGKISLLLALALMVPLLAPVTAHADSGAGNPCGSSKTGSGGKATCQKGGGGSGGGYVPPDTAYQIIYVYPPPNFCFDQNNNPSEYGDLEVPDKPDTLIKHHCITVYGGGPGDVVRSQATDLVIAPQPASDFAGDFLTGAPIQFCSAPFDATPTGPQCTDDAKLDNYTAPVPGFPDTFLQATPVSYSWNFGDGSPTSTGIAPKYTYQSDTPDASKPGDHTVTVQLTGTWHLYFHQPKTDQNPDPVEDLGLVTKTGTITKTIVQIWSAQTQPNGAQ